MECKTFQKFNCVPWRKNVQICIHLMSNLTYIIQFSKAKHIITKKYFELVMKKVYMFMIYPYSLSTYYGVDHSELNVKIGLAWLIYILAKSA